MPRDILSGLRDIFSGGSDTLQGGSDSLGDSEPPPSPFVQDSFTAVSTTNFEAYTPEIGGTPVKNAAFAGTMVVDGASDSLRHSGTTTAAYYYPATPPSADYRFALDVVCKTRISGDNPVFYLRFDTTVNNGLRLAWGATANQWTLARVVSGVGVTSLGTFNQTPTAATTYHVTGLVQGSTVSVWIDTPESSAPTMTGAVGPVTAAGKVGIGNTGTVTNSASTGIHFDNLTVVEL